jgi:predicted AlkP superfamily phosphohydrolase/phosphomutase
MTRVLVIGLDGVPLDLIRSWAQEGKLPIFKSIMDEGVVGPLKSTIPPTTGPSWSAFMTGKNPGKTSTSP